jgi:hypothetical protein
MPQAHALPARPNLQYLKKLAKRRVALDRKAGKPVTLALAQLAIAREFGFPSWRKLRERIAAPVNLSHVFRDVMKAIMRRDDDGLVRLIARAPEVVNRTGPHPEWGGRPQPLHVAIETGNVFAFKTLLDAGADINGDQSRYDRWSPLMLSIHWKRNAFRDELIKRGARVDLIAALMMKIDRLVGRLLKDPAALNGPLANDATPLHFARTVKSARLLIERGVDTGARNKYGLTAAEVWARQKPRRAGLMRLAKTLGVTAETDLLEAVWQGRLTAARNLLRKGGDANSRYPSGSKGTLLHTAAWNGDLAMVKLLVSRGADIHAIDEEHKATAAHFARHALKVLDRKACAGVVEYLENLMK